MSDQSESDAHDESHARSDALDKLGQAAGAIAERDTEVARSIRFYRRTIFVVLCIVLPALGYTAWGQHESKGEINQATEVLDGFYARSEKNGVLLLCTAGATRSVSLDVRALIKYGSAVTLAELPVPAVCKIEK